MRRLSIVLPLFPLLLVSGLGCASSGGYAEQPSIPSSGYSSSSSSSGSSFSSGSGFAVPQRGTVRADKIVRPDVVTLVFALQETQPDAQKALGALQAAVADLASQLKEATSGAASLKMCGVSIHPTSHSKSNDGEPAEYSVLADGSIEVGLAADLDFWGRSRLLAAITKVTTGFVARLRASKSTTTLARFNEPQVTVKDPEAHRAKLLEQWIKRARDFAEAAQTAAAPLYLVDCAPPSEIDQRPISLEEVGLSLAVTCKIDTTRPPR